VQAWGSGREDREISRRVRAGRRATVVENKNFLSLAYGYRYEYDRDGNRQVVVDEQAARIIRHLLVDLYLGKGMGKPAIAQALNSEGVPTPEGSSWMSGTVDRYISRRWVYAGYVEFGRFCDQPFARVKGNHPAIISEDEARRIDNENAKRQVGPRRTYALSGVIWCGECGKPMAGNRKVKELTPGSGRNVNYLYLRCRNCKGASVREDYATAELRSFVEYIISLEDISQFVDDTEYSAAQQEITRRMVEVDKQLTESASATERLLDAYESGVLPQDRLIERIQVRQNEQKVLQVERADLQRQLDAWSQAGPPQERAEEIKRNGLAILEMTDEEPLQVRRWLRDHIRIIAVKGQITDIYLLP
jgi:hypothetical protein